MTCQQASFPADTEMNVFTGKEKPKQFTTAPKTEHRSEAQRGV